MLLTPENITRGFIMAVCVTGMAVFVFLWALSDFTAVQTSLYFTIIAAFALGAVSPFRVGAFMGRMICLVSFLTPVYGPVIFSYNAVPKLNQVWPGMLLGFLMASPHILERTIRFGLDLRQRLSRHG